VYRSHEGPDDAWNLTSLCAWHHQRGAHGTGLTIEGRAPDDLVFELPVGLFLSGDRRVAIRSLEAGMAASEAKPSGANEIAD
jgi:hypothetical protein